MSPYGASKLMAERILADHGAAYGTRHAALRYFNAAGADPDGEVGECRVAETHLVPLVLDAVLGVRPALRVMGADYPTPDGTAVRDYVHVSDLADAHVAALRHLLAGRGSLQVNLGTGRGHSVREVIEAARRVTGRPVPFEVAGRRPGDPPELVADPGAAAAALGFRATRSLDIESIVSDAWRWHERALARHVHPMQQTGSRW